MPPAVVQSSQTVPSRLQEASRRLHRLQQRDQVLRCRVGIPIVQRFPLRPAPTPPGGLPAATAAPLAGCPGGAALRDGPRPSSRPRTVTSRGLRVASVNPTSWSSAGLAGGGNSDDAQPARHDRRGAPTGRASAASASPSRVGQPAPARTDRRGPHATAELRHRRGGHHGGDDSQHLCRAIRTAITKGAAAANVEYSSSSVELVLLLPADLEDR